MRALRLSLVLFAFLFAAFGRADAQAEPLRIGGTLPGEIAWSPDGAHLLVAASDMTRLYRTGEWDAPLRTFPAALKAKWVNMRVMELDGQRYEVRTGRAVETPEVVVTQSGNFYVPKLSPNGRYLYESDTRWFSVLKLTDTQNPDAEIISLPLNDDASVERVVFSPNEHYLAVVYKDSSDKRRRLQLWNIDRQERIFEVRAHNMSTFKDVRFSLNGYSLIAIEGIDGYYSVYGTDSFEYLHQWRTITGELIFTQRGKPIDPITYAPNSDWFAFSPDGYETRKSLTIWTGARLISIPSGYIHETAFSRDGAVLFALDEESITLYRLDMNRHTATEQGSIDTAQRHAATAGLSDSGQLLLIKDGYQAKPTLWRTEDLTLIGELDTEHGLNDVLFSPDDTLLTLDRQNFWDARTGDKVVEFSTSVEIAPNWSDVAFWDSGEMVIYDLGDGSETRQALIDPESSTVLAIDPLHRWVLIERAGELAAYQMNTGELVFTVPTDAPNKWPMITADGSDLIVALGDGPNKSNMNRLSLYDISSGHAAVYQSTIDIYWWQGLVSADGSMTANRYSGGSMMPTLEWHDIASGELLGQWRTDNGQFEGVAFHPTKPWMVILTSPYWSQRQVIYVIDVIQTIEGGGEPVALLSQMNETISLSAPRFSPRGNFVILKCGDYCFRLTDLRDLPEIGILIEPEAITVRNVSALAFNADETMLLSKSSLATEAHLRLDIEAEPVATLPATGPAIALNADGTRAATVTADGIALWDVNAVRAGDLTPLAVYPITGLAPTQLTFDADNRLIALEPSGVTIYEPPASSSQ